MLHPTLWGHGILSTNALLLCCHILLVGHLLLLLRRHVVWGHATTTPRHTCLWGRDLSMIDIFWRVDGRFGIDAIFIAGCRLRRIEAGLLEEESVEANAPD